VKIYTRGGDRGQTSLYSGERLAKDDPRIEALGSLDELVSALGIAKAELSDGALAEQIQQLQTDLYLVMAEVASTGTESRLPAEAAQSLEARIDEYQAQLPPLRDFLIPGASRQSAALHHARTICRRAERRAVAVGLISERILTYLNRLADFIFVLARWVDRESEASTFKDKL
jgi:cob(I)alamin adenosyltransferase